MPLTNKLYAFLTGDGGKNGSDQPVCNELSEAACGHQPRNFFIHLISLTSTKTADGLMDPKLVLAWLLTTLGSPAFFLGLLVPVREAGALLPQLFISSALQRLQRRKWVWSAGALGQGLSVSGMALCAISLEGAQLGWAILALLTVFSLARSLCSVSYKDVQGKTIAKTRRGTVTGTAATCSSVLVLLFGVLMASGLVDITVGNIAIALGVAGVLGVGAGTIFSFLYEDASPRVDDDNQQSVFSQISLLKTEPQLLVFIATRALLVATALAPPFLVALSGGGGQQLGQLGGFVIASALASTLSSYIWGRLADRSSRKVLAIAALLAAATLALVISLEYFGDSLRSISWLSPLMLFALMVAYQGVRLGRNTHLVDMAPAEQRAAFTAVSNSVIGVVLLAGAGFGLLAELAGTVSVLACFAVMCFSALPLALRLEEVQH